MERLSANSTESRWLGFFRFGRERWGWEARRILRFGAGRLGYFGWSVIGASILSVTAICSAQYLYRQNQLWHAALVAVKASSANATRTRPDASGGKEDLLAFEGRLLPHEAIPWAVGDILAQAEKQGLVVQHAEYQVNEDVVGGFLRYRMVLPIRGRSEAVYQFVQSALWTQQNLALEGVQFKRDNAASEMLEARVHWVLLVQLPRSTPSGSVSRGGRQ